MLFSVNHSFYPINFLTMRSSDKNSKPAVMMIAGNFKKTFCQDRLIHLINHLNLYHFPSLLTCDHNFNFCCSYLSAAFNMKKWWFQRTWSMCDISSQELLTFCHLFISIFLLDFIALSFHHLKVALKVEIFPCILWCFSISNVKLCDLIQIYNN